MSLWIICPTWKRVESCYNGFAPSFPTDHWRWCWGIGCWVFERPPPPVLVDQCIAPLKGALICVPPISKTWLVGTLGRPYTVAASPLWNCFPRDANLTSSLMVFQHWMGEDGVVQAGFSLSFNAFASFLISIIWFLMMFHNVLSLFKWLWYLDASQHSLSKWTFTEG